MVTESSLYLVITDVNHSHVEIITFLYDCVKQIHLLVMPAIIDISNDTHCFVKPTVHLQWPHPIAIAVFGIVREVPLPVSVRLPLPLARLLYQSTRSTRDIANYPMVAVTLRAQCGCGCRTSRASTAKIINSSRPQPSSSGVQLRTPSDYLHADDTQPGHAAQPGSA